MQITKISAATPISTMAMAQTSSQSVKEQKVSNPIEQSSSRTSQILRNYFMGGQKVNFTGFPCNTSNFKVKELPDMPCTCCGRPMMTNKQTDEFAVKAGNLAGAGLNQLLEETMPYFRAEEKAIVHYIQKQLKDMPDASLTTAITRSNADASEILKDEQVDVLKRTIDKSKEMLGDKNLVQNACERSLAQSFGINDVQGRKKQTNFSNFNRTDFLTNLVELEQNKGVDHEKMHEILEVAVQLPESEKIINKMLTDYGHGSDQKFAKRLIQKAVVTAEHIHPKSKGGPNATNNYMGECQECNGSRGNMSYDDWMKKYPNMPDNIQDNIDAVTEEIVKGKIGGNYDDYPVDLKEAVDKETNGKVILVVKNPEEIDKMREERGLPKPQADAKEKAGASGPYQGSYHGTPGMEEAPRKTSGENKTRPSKKGGKKGGKRHIDANATIVRYPSQVKTQTEQAA